MRRRNVGASVGLIIAFTGCTVDPPAAPMGGQPSTYKQRAAPASLAGCTAEFTLVVTDEDPEYQLIGLGALADTSTICASWNGSDYSTQSVTIGSSDAIPDLPVDVAGGAYQDGQITPLAPSGVALDGPAPIASSAFTLGGASASEVAAAYDDPWYNVRGCVPDVPPAPPPGGGGPSPEPPPIMMNADCSPSLLQRASHAEFTRHGIRRAGVRALVEALREIEQSSEGHRRFAGRDGDAEIVRTVDAKSHLLLEEEIQRPGEHVHLRHTWRLDKGGRVYLHERVEIETRETKGARSTRSRTVLGFDNIRLREG